MIVAWQFTARDAPNKRAVRPGGYGMIVWRLLVATRVCNPAFVESLGL